MVAARAMSMIFFFLWFQSEAYVIGNDMYSFYVFRFVWEGKEMNLKKK